MTIKIKNQNEIFKIFGINQSYNKKPINRIKTVPEVIDKLKKLENLREKIEMIEDCELKKKANKIVFNDGNENSHIMFVGEGPGQREDEIGKPFVGDAGLLLNKMLNAINLKRKDIYITNVVNYRPPGNRKPETNEILKYAEFLKEHICIINPKILVLMGSTAMEALFGKKIKISKSRGEWQNLIINNKLFKTIITFHPAYLLRQPDQKRFSWEDLKKIKKEIDIISKN